MRMAFCQLKYSLSKKKCRQKRDNQNLFFCGTCYKNRSPTIMCKIPSGAHKIEPFLCAVQTPDRRSPDQQYQPRKLVGYPCKCVSSLKPFPQNTDQYSDNCHSSCHPDRRCQISPAFLKNRYSAEQQYTGKKSCPSCNLI